MASGFWNIKKQDVFQRGQLVYIAISLECMNGYGGGRKCCTGETRRMGRGWGMEDKMRGLEEGRGKLK